MPNAASSNPASAMNAEPWENWAKGRYPDHPRMPKAKSIQNALGKLYYELRLLAAS